MAAPITVTREYVVPFTLSVSKRISPGTYSSVTPREILRRGARGAHA